MRTHLALVGLLASPLAGCGDDTSCTLDDTYHPVIDPTNFVDDVTNPLFPLVPGTIWIYQNGDEVITITVQPDRKVIRGVSTVVVHDQAVVAGEVIEDTTDWYAQAADGAVWYFGEATMTFPDHDTFGSWEAGVDGAEPGIIMPAAPAPGAPAYRQEYRSCVAEDMGQILAVDATATVPAGSHTGCVKTRDFTPLESDVNEEKYYCPGVGVVLIVDIATGDREELLSKTP